MIFEEVMIAGISDDFRRSDCLNSDDRTGRADKKKTKHTTGLQKGGMGALLGHTELGMMGGPAAGCH